MGSEHSYEIKRNEDTNFYTVTCDHVTIADDLEFDEAVIMLETLIFGDRITYPDGGDDD